MTQVNHTASAKSQILTTNEDLVHVRMAQSTGEQNTSLGGQRASPPEPSLIPNEIWAEIFVWYAVLWCTFRVTAPSSSAWRLGHVCREWRNLALSIPQLWDHPPVVRLTPESLKGGYFRTGWEVFLHRSGTLPLKLHLSFEFSVNSQILTPFFDHVNRWEHLTISGLTVMQAQLRFQKIFKRLPLLRSVTLNFAPTTSDLACSPSFDIFEFAPKLTHINLHSPSTSFLKSRLRFPWKQLTNYNESGIDMGTFPVLLDFSHHLETLQYRGRNFTYISTEPFAQFRLRHLIVETKEIAQFWRQLENVTLPALKTFSVRALRPTLERLPHIPTLTDFIARSGCPLKKLVLDFDSGPFDHVAMKALFSCLDELESLELGDCHDSTRTMSLLKFRQDERTLLPRLRSLTLHDHEGFNDASIISDLALSRERSVAGETSPERLLVALEHIRVVTPKIYGRYNVFCKLSATDSAVRSSFIESPTTGLSRHIRALLEKVRKSYRHVSYKEATPELISVFVLAYFSEDARVRKDTLNDLEKLGVLSVVRSHLLRRRWIPGCKEDILYVHPIHHDAAAAPELWEALDTANLNTLELFLGYHLANEKEDDLKDIE